MRQPHSRLHQLPSDHRGRAIKVSLADLLGLPTTPQGGGCASLVSNAVSQSFARKVEAEGVTVAEWAFLRVLYDVEPVAPSLLAERMGMTKGAISKLADRLVEKALVERAANLGDGRGQRLALSPTIRLQHSIRPNYCEQSGPRG